MCTPNDVKAFAKRVDHDKLEEAVLGKARDGSSGFVGQLNAATTDDARVTVLDSYSEFMDESGIKGRPRTFYDALVYGHFGKIQGKTKRTIFS